MNEQSPTRRLLLPLRKVLALSRPVLWINTIGPAWVGLWTTGLLWRASFLPLLLWLTLPFNLLIYGVNDITDLDTDALNDRKGGWEGARVGKHEIAGVLAWVAALNGPFVIYFALTYRRDALVALAIYTMVFLLYSLPPRLKARPFLDSASNAAYALPLVFVPLALNHDVIWPAALGLMAWSTAKHCFDSIQDIEQDRRAGLRTTAVVLDKRGALVFCGAFWLLSCLAFARLSVSLAALNGLYAVLLLSGMAFAKERASERRLYVYSVAFPYVVGTYGGVALALAVFLGKWSAP